MQDGETRNEKKGMGRGGNIKESRKFISAGKAIQEEWKIENVWVISGDHGASLVSTEPTSRRFDEWSYGGWPVGWVDGQGSRKRREDCLQRRVSYMSPFDVVGSQ